MERHKDAATVAYEGTRGSQWVVVRWAEQGVIVADQFRDDHVPASCANVRALEQAVANFPQRVKHLAPRADSALHEIAILRWCGDKNSAYAISADMSKPLRAENSGPPGRSGSGSCSSTPWGKSSRRPGGGHSGSPRLSNMSSWFGFAGKSSGLCPLSRRLEDD